MSHPNTTVGNINRLEGIKAWLRTNTPDTSPYWWATVAYAFKLHELAYGEKTNILEL